MSDNKFLGTLAFDDFDNLVQNYINRSEPDAISFDNFQELADESNQSPVEIVLVGVIKDNLLQLHMPQPATVPLRIQDNQIQPLNLRLIIQLPLDPVAANIFASQSQPA